MQAPDNQGEPNAPEAVSVHPEIVLEADPPAYSHTPNQLATLADIIAAAHTPEITPSRLLAIIQRQQADIERLQSRLSDLEARQASIAAPVPPQHLIPLAPRQWQVCRVYAHFGEYGVAARSLGVSSTYVASVCRLPQCKAWLNQYRIYADWILAHESVSNLPNPSPRSTPRASSRRRT